MGVRYMDMVMERHARALSVCCVESALSVFKIMDFLYRSAGRSRFNRLPGVRLSAVGHGCVSSVCRRGAGSGRELEN